MKESYLTRGIFYGIVGLILTIFSLCVYFLEIPFMSESIKFPCTGCLVAIAISNVVKCIISLMFHYDATYYPF